MHDDPHHHDHHHHDHAHRHAHGPGHNHSHDGEHLHSHVHADAVQERAEELRALAGTFIDGFRRADDKQAFLKLAGVPDRIEGEDGLTMHLIDAAITGQWQLGTASPAFGSRELSVLRYPGSMIAERETMTLTYVSMTGRKDIDIVDMLGERATKPPER